ncbi:hypothetical protein KPL76_11700 [Subtercola sp. PAMC28395]|uniref:hypothetical protein n=1 Tax=Subtercola sp. PAMC28395 TaxID=2846775 RepID=UPI001C0C5D21|nr:hypothetical protein [Subtercola sp. PAMC28395]QWT23383.1 hypothetical protein KPL76_11700 [Subtercola sp. PAMC28395]
MNRKSRRVIRAMVAGFLGLALAAVLAGCTGGSGPTGSPMPTPTVTGGTEPSSGDPTQWGTYGSRAEACLGVGGDVVALALIPNNLALMNDSAGIGGLDDAIQTMAVAAPPVISGHYLQISAMVLAFGRELDTYNAIVHPPTATPDASADRQPAAASAGPGVPSPSLSASDPPRPSFDTTSFGTQLDGIKEWLKTDCS